MPWVIHRDGAGAAPEREVFRREVGATGLVLETCLRRLALGVGTPPPLSGELATGAAAYRVLLEVVAGLRSAVLGETNVAGQFRRSWDAAAGQLPPAERAALAPWVDSVLADAAVLRRTHLQGLGGSSWGTLVRRLLQPAREARVLLIGAGDLAASVAPYLGHVTLGLWTRRELAAERRASLSMVDHWFAVDDADAAARWAELVVVTSPADASHDAAWIRRLAERAVPLTAGLHLGQRRPTAFRWPADTRGLLLDDVLALAERQQERRRSARDRALAFAGELAARRCGEPAADCRARA